MSRLPARSTRPSAFANYRRTDRRLPAQDPSGPEIEFKFNPYHDPETGRFTFAPGGGAGAGQSPPGAALATGQRRPTPPLPRDGRDRSVPNRPGASAPGMPPEAGRGRPDAPVPPLPATERFGDLSAAEESRGNAATISSGRGDPGGRSYGPYQVPSRNGAMRAFVASPEFGGLADQFQGLTPGTAAFDQRWRDVATRDPAAIERAQYEYIRRTNYAPAVRRVREATGYDLDTASHAVREAVWSVSVQHGGVASILADAVRRTDERLQQSNADRDETMINSIYDARTDYVTRLRDRAQRAAEQTRDRARRASLLDTVRAYNTILTDRYPRERAAALEMRRQERNPRGGVSGGSRQ
jgi:hypothetical protein